MRKVPQSYNAEIYHSAILRVFTLRFLRLAGALIFAGVLVPLLLLGEGVRG